MTDQRQIDFYHLKDEDLYAPVAMLSEKTVGIGQKMLILSPAQHMDSISEVLWTRKRESFLAHGRDDEAGFEHAPVWLSADVEKNPNDAQYVCLTSGLVPQDLSAFQRVFMLFDGTRDTAVAFARSCWKDWSANEGVRCRYFVQDETGNWVKKA